MPEAAPPPPAPHPLSAGQAPARAWILLILLSLLATALALGQPLLPAGLAWLAGLAVLAIAGAKARIILSGYLELAGAPRILRGFVTALALFLLGAAGLYLAA